eukprot:CAMPEP_0181295650 /NCGR_PEP_ID=MMETSP1101-20121128/4264_1 /TAXON_ID=46948 /ORGANISM="Rhodomonas abbreviata, Strain Caron Lab Isolate" /LENGTH=264 /DNA_ID=CAMNT_0023400423 /DNA_START=95 /DNA_END=889 /DNA_ORIENTATION=+
MLAVCSRSRDSKDAQEVRCILCGEKKCSGCQALFQKNYRQQKSERRTRKAAQGNSTQQRTRPTTTDHEEHLTDAHSKGPMLASMKKDACFYSQDSIPLDDEAEHRPGFLTAIESAGERGVSSGRKAGKEGRSKSKSKVEKDDVYVWFKEPLNLPSEQNSLFAASEFTVYEFVLQWRDRRWAVQRRFREFAALDAALDESLPDAIALPPFPSKQLLARMNPEIIRKRRSELQFYLRTILADSSASLSHHVRSFCDFPRGCKEGEL